MHLVDEKSRAMLFHRGFTDILRQTGLLSVVIKTHYKCQFVSVNFYAKGSVFKILCCLTIVS